MVASPANWPADAAIEMTAKNEENGSDEDDNEEDHFAFYQQQAQSDDEIITSNKYFQYRNKSKLPVEEDKENVLPILRK